MTEVATVTSQTTAKHTAGAKGAGATASTGAGTGTGLDGAFAALLDAAGQMPADGSAMTEGKTAHAAIDPALATGDPALAGVVNPEAVEAAPLPGDTDPATGKPRKSARAKDTPKGEDVVLPAQAAIAGMASVSVQPVVGEPSKAPAKTGPAAVTAITASATGSQAAVTPAATTDAATAALDLVAKADKPATVAAEAAPAPAVVKEQAPVSVQAGAIHGETHQQDGQAGDHRGDPRDRGADRAPPVALAANDDATSTIGADPLREIVQSLPPVVQAQLGPIAPASAAPAASTGDLLNSQVIDMSVSGQWIDRMAREIATVADGSGNARFQLNPPNLGRIQVELMQADDKTNVRLLTETDEAARRLREGHAALEANARAASLSLGSVSVEKSSAPFESSDKQNQRQSAEQNSNPNQQNSAQAQGQSAQGRNNNSGGNLNRGGFSAVMGNERLAEPEQSARTTRASDPRVRFA